MRTSSPPRLTGARRSWPGDNPQSVTDARHWLMEQLAGESKDARNRVEVIASELLTNAVKHTRSGEPGGEFALAFMIEPTLVQLCVTDWGAREQAAEPATEGGWGLTIVAEMAKAWGKRPLPGGRITWALVAR